MEFLEGQKGPLVHEHIYDKGHQVIGHRIIPAASNNDGISLHPAPAHGVIVTVKGQIEFGTEKGPEILEPGRIAIMEKGEQHYIKALADSEIFVILDKEM